MKRLICFVIVVLFALELFGFGKLRVESIKELAVTHTSIKVRDADGKFAPALIVKTELRGLGFRNVSRLTKHAATYDEGKHEYTFYLNDKQRVIEITHSEYEPLEVRLLADFGIEVKAQRVYEMVLTNIPEKISVNVVINTEPSDAVKWVDGKNLGKGRNFRITTGEHTIEIEKKGYESIRNEKITINEENIYFEFTLKKAEFVPLIINSNPTGAKIFIDDVEMKGTTPVDGFFDAGKRRIKITKEKYVDYEGFIEIGLPKTEKTYTLQPDFGTIIISTDSEIEMNIYLNNEYEGKAGKTARTLMEMPAIEYVLRAEHEKNLYTIEPQTFTLSRGGEERIILTPQKNFCTVDISCEPDIEMKIFFDDEYVGKSGIDPLSLEPVSPGKHTIRAEHEKNLYTVDSFSFDLERGEVKKIIFKPQVNFGSIDISCKPRVEMEVSLNDVIIGKTPLTLNEIVKGKYTITAKHDLYSVTPQTFFLEREENKRIILNPQSNFGSLELSSDPEVNLKIYFDGIYQGETPLTISPVFEGEHSIEAEHKYYKADPFRFSIEPDEQISKTIIAKQNFGILNIKTSKGTKIYLNDDLITQYENIKLNPITINLRAENHKCEPAESKFILEVGDQITEELFPKPITGTILVTANPKEAKIELMGDAGEYFSGKGIESFKDIPYGTYNLKVTRENYISYEEEVNLEKDKQIRRDVELTKINYIFDFSISSASYRIENLDFEIKLNSKIIYSGKGKKQILFSEKGIYKIEITKDKDFGFSKSIAVDKGKTYNISIINDIAIEKERVRRENEQIQREKEEEIKRKQREEEEKRRRKRRKNNEFAKKIYYNSKGKYSVIDEGLMHPSWADYLLDDNKDFGLYTNLKLMIYSYSKYPAYQTSGLMGKLTNLSSSRILQNKNILLFWGISILNTVTYTPEFVFFDFLSFNIGYFIRTNNHKNRFIFELDVGCKYTWGKNIQEYNNNVVMFIKELEIEENTLSASRTTFGGWMPGDFSISFEKYLGGRSFFVIRSGIWLFPIIGTQSHPDAKWYYQEDIDDWSQGDPLPQPIDGEPDHPIYQGIIPYIGCGIRF